MLCGVLLVALVQFMSKTYGTARADMDTTLTPQRSCHIWVETCRKQLAAYIQAHSTEQRVRER